MTTIRELETKYGVAGKRIRAYMRKNGYRARTGDDATAVARYEFDDEGAKKLVALLDMRFGKAKEAKT